MTQFLAMLTAVQTVPADGRPRILSLLPIALILSNMVAVGLSADGETEASAPAVTIDPVRLTVEVGNSNEVTCTADTAGTLSWLDPYGNPVSESANSSRIWSGDDGILTLGDAAVNDTGTYTCVVNMTSGCQADTACNATFEYKVYVMPDYTVDGIIVLVINGVLLVVFAGCLIRSWVVDRKRLNKYVHRGL